mgnify:CR=1 FL=1
MWRLVIETGGDSCQVGLMRGEEIVGGWRWDWPRRHAERLVWMVSEVLREGGLAWEEISGAAIMIGPGSHTGLRVGLAAVKAWALRWGWGIYPVPLLRVLYEIVRHHTGLERGILTLWQTRGEQAYGHLWNSPQQEGMGAIHPLSEWETVDAEIAVGNVRLGPQWLYVPQVSWIAVGQASLGVEALTEPEAIVSLVPIYFRPFIPTVRKHGAAGASSQGR